MRILAGAHKGRRLLAPPSGSGTRPITSLVKKSLFDMLGGRLEGAVVVDLYCGTGTLGLEALSRGAERVCFAERDRLVLSRLRRNIEALGAADRCEVWAGDVAASLRRRLAGPVDVAFVDPPYAQARRWSWQAASDMILAPLAERLAPDGVVVVRVPAGCEPPDELGALAVRRRRRYGEMALALLGRREESA